MNRHLRAAQHYFIDESGDLTLFDSKGRVIVGNEGVSRVFILGAAFVENPGGLQNDMNLLRMRLLADPYFAGVPSFDLARNKTAAFFHAKDDLPEVRKEVFALIRDHPVHVVAAIRRKAVLADAAAQRFATTGKKISDSEIYDSLVEQVLTERLHLAEHSHIWFARRGKKERREALAAVIERARHRFEEHNRDAVIARLGDRQPATSIYSAHPSEVAGLQVIDYCLWALHRLLERGETRYFDYIRTKFRAIWDIDDVRIKPQGECYRGGDQRPIEGGKLLPVVS